MTEYERFRQEVRASKMDELQQNRLLRYFKPSYRAELECLLPGELVPRVFVILGTLLLDKCKVNELIKIAVVLVVNNVCYALANFIFAYAKHYLRIRLCRRLGLKPTERNIAVMESMEYQSV